ncbi:lactococcin 972 family bacteriocin [Leuconostoc mesenteroides]|uniref:lactococcin 972 family bacteriocin n=1 Tax=Leuconostoc mesenteroides TaxID=1245 RepID=UPI00076114A2|nr:lactococcin 972 family bacteriocin [Leuconostoc mesenteroides]KAA8380312.1 hypothetical protein FE413_00735 [Leuconostoc mesenteroides]
MGKKATMFLLSGLLGLILVPAVNVSADTVDSSNSSTEGGYVNLSTTNKTLATQVIPLNGNNVFTVSKAAVNGKGLVPYAWHSIDGGDWLFGVYGTKVQSTYKHSSRNHTATAQNGFGSGPRVKAPAGGTAFSQVTASVRNNQAYYGFY